MNPSETNTEPSSHPSPFSDYRYHDPEFVAWWLQGLYVFSMETQVEIATLLHRIVNVPEVQEVISDFIVTRKGVAHEEPLEGYAEEGTDALSTASISEVVVVRLKSMWTDQRRLVLVGGVVALFVAVKGVVALVNLGRMLAT